MSLRKQKTKREPWINPRPRMDKSRMDSCPEAKARASILERMGCCVCHRPTQEIHHLRAGAGMGERAPWWRTIPLCLEHHANSSPYSVHGRDRARFFQDHGDEESLLARVNARLPERLTSPKDPPPLPSFRSSLPPT